MIYLAMKVAFAAVRLPQERSSSARGAVRVCH